MLQVYQKYCIQLKSQLRHGDVQLITDELQTIHFGLKVTSNIVRNILENGHHKSEALLQAVFESAMKLIRAHAAEAEGYVNEFTKARNVEITLLKDEEEWKADRRRRLQEKEGLINH